MTFLRNITIEKGLGYFMQYLAIFLYCIVVAVAYGSLFGKKFSESLAPAFFIHILIIIFTSVLFHHISFGIVIGFVLACGILLYKLVISLSEKSSLLADVVNDTGFLIFLLFFLFIIFSNTDKFFMEWDEFSHWGVFLKEMLRIDDLYCVSTKNITHKDYVPAITIFEVLWCKLSGRYVEADAYRAMQMLQFAMILPMLSMTEYGQRNEVVERGSLKINFYKIGTDVSKAILALSIPIVFSGQSFYHTIYQDMIFGILIFYCVYLVWCKTSNEEYRCLELTIALTILVLSKMTAIAFLPMIVVYYIVNSIQYNKRNVKKWYWMISLIFPIAIWGALNKYISLFVPQNGGNQSYSGMSSSDIISVIKNDGTISYQNQVASRYWSEIIHEGIVGRMSYVHVVVLVAIFVLLIGKLAKSKYEKSYLLLDLWIVLAGIAYALLMYFLYLTAFVEVEAVNLISYDRYMNSYLVAAVMLGIAVFYSVDNVRILRLIILLSMAFWLITPITNGYCVSQMMPGYVTGDIKRYEEYSKYVDVIEQNTPETVETMIYMITCGDNGNICAHIDYYSNPRTIYWESVGSPRYDGDIYSIQYDIDEFVNKASEYEYLYLANIDDDFKKNYGEAFANQECVREGNIMKIQIKDGKIYKYCPTQVD